MILTDVITWKRTRNMCMYIKYADEQSHVCTPVFITLYFIRGLITTPVVMAMQAAGQAAAAVGQTAIAAGQAAVVLVQLNL